jgi:hypothetical protein
MVVLLDLLLTVYDYIHVFSLIGPFKKESWRVEISEIPYLYKEKQNTILKRLNAR